jgi:hypothetical protein
MSTAFQHQQGIALLHFHQAGRGSRGFALNWRNK